jgi:hypothetical protein
MISKREVAVAMRFMPSFRHKLEPIPNRAFIHHSRWWHWIMEISWFWERANIGKEGISTLWTIPIDKWPENLLRRHLTQISFIAFLPSYRSILCATWPSWTNPWSCLGSPWTCWKCVSPSPTPTTFFLYPFFLWNNEAVVHYSDLWHAVFYVLRRPRPQDAGTPLLTLLHFFYPTIQCNCSACNVPPDAWLQKKTNFSTLIVGLVGTGDRSRATCVAGSGNNLLAIHYDFYSDDLLEKLLLTSSKSIDVAHDPIQGQLEYREGLDTKSYHLTI